AAGPGRPAAARACRRPAGTGRSRGGPRGLARRGLHEDAGRRRSQGADHGRGAWRNRPPPGSRGRGGHHGGERNDAFVTANVENATTADPVLEVEDLRVWYGTERGAVRAVDG